jgi:carbamoyltransferase
MTVLGLLHGHNSSSALIGDKLEGCISEERLTRVKNATGFPKLSSQQLLSQAGMSIADVELVVSASRAVPFVNDRQIKIYEDERVNKASTLESKIKKFLHQTYYYLPVARGILERLYLLHYEWQMSGSQQAKARDRICEELGFEGEIVFADHHLCHAYTGYFGFVPVEYRDRPYLVFTLDGEGDGLCATISTVKDGQWSRVSKTTAGHSVASFYGAITKFLGMKVNEHEYKVMGLAPYCSPGTEEELVRKFHQLFRIQNDLSFSAKGGGNFMSLWLAKNLDNYRFDVVAAAAQRFVEDIALDWITRAVEKYGIPNIVLSGGFFMNIKVNQRIRELDVLDKMFVCPSGGDESIALGACYYGLEKLGKPRETKQLAAPNLYLGSDIDAGECREVADSVRKKGIHKVEECDDVEEAIARLLADGEIVARVSGRMEFGARALGNRSILANASSHTVVRDINKLIKGRDFWMPFACSILEEHAFDYLEVETLESLEYMAMGAPTKALAQTHLAAGIHQYDHSARPQIVKRSQNPEYHKIISRYRELTGMGGILNTSLNLHGEPLVCSPTDAMHTFERSGLPHLTISNFLISKS